MLLGAELLAAYGHRDEVDIDIQPQKLQYELFSGPSMQLYFIIMMILVRVGFASLQCISNRVILNFRNNFAKS